jgi:uncharacterized alpha-E superfamily protein
MLSRVADSLYWMSRYFERADHSARVLDANYNLLLNPAKASTEQRWQRITAILGLGSEATEVDPVTAISRLVSDAATRSSIISCITIARDNASQVREQISSEMWERLNQLYHEVRQSTSSRALPAEPVRLITLMREGSYQFDGVTHATMNHGEAWQFIRLGRYMERASALPVLLDAVFCAQTSADDLDWVGLLTSCSAFEAYCKVYTADLKPDRVAEFLLLNPEFPYTVRYSADQMQMALESINRSTSTPARRGDRIEKLIGRLRSALAYGQIGDIMSRDFQRFLRSITEQCQSLHAAVHEVYIEYPIESAFEA